MAKRYGKQVRRGPALELTVDGIAVVAYEGETVASVLLLEGKTATYRTRGNRPRMMFCNMGTCFECRVRVTQGGAAQWVLACMTPVQAHMQIETGVNLAQSLPGLGADV